LNRVVVSWKKIGGRLSLVGYRIVLPLLAALKV